MSGRIRGLLERLLGSRQSETASAIATDTELLQQFVVGGDQKAFELLVWRHGVMVLGVCQRLIRDEHLAEDAFQAVFLVLAKKARAIRSENVAGWLYRIARRVAARVIHNRDQMSELQFVAVEETESPIEREELSELLDAEIARLPERLRRPLLLCYLGGRSTEEAAHELGCPRGTILSRLSTARRRLAERLSRQGVTLPAALVVVGFELNGRLVSATVTAALRFLVEHSPLDPVSFLAQGVIRTMTHGKLLTVFGVVLAAGLIGGVGWVTARTESGELDGNSSTAQTEPRQELPAAKNEDELVRFQQPTTEKKNQAEQLAETLKLDPVFLNSTLDPALLNALKPDLNDTPLRKLQRERCRARAVLLAKYETLIEIGKWNPLEFSETIKVPISLSENLLELMEKPADKLKCYELRVKHLKSFEQFTDIRVRVGTDPSQNRNIATAARIDAEIDLLRFKAEMAKLKK